MKKLLISLAMVLVLVAVMTMPVMAVEQSEEASVTVNEFISFTITDNGATGINFGPVAPGTPDSPEVAQTGVLGAVTLAIGAETNVDGVIETKGDADFSDGATHTIPIGNGKWHDSDDKASGTAMTTTYATVATFTAAGGAMSVDVWHWLTIDSGQTAGTYTTDFFYQAVAP